MLPALLGALAGHHLDPADALADAALGDDDRRAEVAATSDVGAAAQLARPAAEVDHPDVRRVLLVEQRDRATRSCVGEGHEGHAALEVAPDAVIDAVLDLGDLSRGQRPGKREVEGRVVRSDERPPLEDRIAEHLAEGAVEQVRGAVVPGDPRPARSIDPSPDALPAAQLARFDQHVMGAGVAAGDGLGVADEGAPARPLQGAGVAHLAPGLGIERRDVQQHGSALAGLERRTL